jgi:serine/threonine protein kinase
MSERIPSKLGKYEIEAPIARGSMGMVYRGYDPYIDRPVAIKVALAESLKDKDSGERYRKMFFNEAHTAGMLRHPNILDIFDAGVEGDICYIVMELVQGGETVRSYTRPDALLPVNQVVEIVFKCAKALDYAHRQGVIHRDIKPSNLLVTPDKDVKIADFSIACLTAVDTSQTMPMGFIGSPRYMSPEQIQEDTVTHHTDIFSLGVVMYELLTAKHPFGGDTFSKLIYRIINEDPVPLETYRKDLPEGVEKIIQKCLVKDPARRYKTGLDLASDLSTLFTHLERPQEDVSASDKFNLVKELDFFRGFPDTDIWEILRASVWQEAMPGDDVIVEGDIDDCFFILVRGKVTVSKGGQEIGTLKAGDCFGEMGYISKARRSASVTADDQVSLLKVNSTLIEQVSRDCQLHFCRVFLKTVIQRLAATTQKLVSNAKSENVEA